MARAQLHAPNEVMAKTPGGLGALFATSSCRPNSFLCFNSWVREARLPQCSDQDDSHARVFALRDGYPRLRAGSASRVCYDVGSFSLR